MARYVASRFIQIIPTLFLVTVIVFLLTQFVPGNVVDVMLGAEEYASDERIAQMETYFGLDRPAHIQYLDWMGNVLQGDLGESWRTGQSVWSMILVRLQLTLQLTAGAMAVALLVGIPLGAISAIKENSVWDHIVRVVSLFSLSIPTFWQAAMLILVLSLWFGISPPTRYVPPMVDPVENFRIMFLPSLVLGTIVAGTIMRMTRSSVLDVMRQDYVRTARAKGLRERIIVSKHMLQNAMIPILTVIGLQVGQLLGGAIIVEQVFTLPGVGRLVLQAINQRDYPVMQGAILIIALLFMLINLAVDLLYGRIDPRIRYS